MGLLEELREYDPAAAARIEHATARDVVRAKFAAMGAPPPTNIAEAVTYLGTKLAMMRRDYYRARVGLAALDLLTRPPKLAAAPTPLHEATRAIRLYAMANHAPDAEKRAALLELADEGAARAERRATVLEKAAVDWSNPMIRGMGLGAGVALPMLPLGALAAWQAGRTIRENVPQRGDIAIGGALGSIGGQLAGNLASKLTGG